MGHCCARHRILGWLKRLACFCCGDASAHVLGSFTPYHSLLNQWVVACLNVFVQSTPGIYAELAETAHRQSKGAVSSRETSRAFCCTSEWHRRGTKRAPHTGQSISQIADPLTRESQLNLLECLASSSVLNDAVV